MAKNFAKSTLASGITSGAATLSVASGEGGKFSTGEPAEVWNKTDFASPADDPDVEVVLVTEISGDTLTITRGQEGTAAVAHNTGGKVYGVIQGPTAGMFPVRGSKSQSSAGAINFASISLPGTTEQTAGIIEAWYECVSGTGERITRVQVLRYAVAKDDQGNGLVTSKTTTPTSGVDGSGAIAVTDVSSFAISTTWSLVASGGNTVTFRMTTANSAGAIASGTLHFEIRDYSGKTITLL